MTYGTQVKRNEASGPHSVIGSLETSQAGNVILRVGRLNAFGWYQTEHIVLTSAEAHALATQLHALAQ